MIAYVTLKLNSALKKQESNLSQFYAKISTKKEINL